MDVVRDQAPSFWNPLSELVSRIQARGGFVNAHAHLDRAYTVLPEDVMENGKTQRHLFEKWKLVDEVKSKSSEDVYFARITAALRQQKMFGVRACLSFIDCDPVAGDRALKAALRAKEWAAQHLEFQFKIACQTLKGVLDKEARSYFEESVGFVDVIGGLPGADKGKESEHLDVLLSTAKQFNKKVHVHVDQLNTMREKETELLARKTIEHGMENKVTAVHGISLAAHPKVYRQEVYKICKDAGLSFVSCPTAWLDSPRSEELSPTHNALTPVEELIECGINVALGTDNISDIYKPFCNGDMVAELRVLLEGCRIHDVAACVNIATTAGEHVI